MFWTHIYQKTSISTIILGNAHITKPSYLKQLTSVTETVSCACCTRTVISLLLHHAAVLLSPIVHVVCYFRDVYPFMYFIVAMYVHHLGLYCILFRRFLMSKINIALQLTVIKESYYY